MDWEPTKNVTFFIVIALGAFTAGGLVFAAMEFAIDRFVRLRLSIRAVAFHWVNRKDFQKWIIEKHPGEKELKGQK